jgi:aldose 1-epimerase
LPINESELFVLANRNGIEIKISPFGGIIVSLKVPGRKGSLADIVLGYADLRSYVHDNLFMGGIIGRYANRMARGEFSLNGKRVRLTRNDGANHLHGGTIGFHKVLWRAKSTPNQGRNSLGLEYLSRDGEEGYPGNLTVQVLYSLDDENDLKIEFTATTDQETVLNLTSHPYFNLAGHGAGDILRHEIALDADSFTPIDANLIPTGEIRAVLGTPFDFTRGRPIGERIDENDAQLHLARGYDHNWVLNRHAAPLTRAAARISDPASGRLMEILTTEPGMQFYTGNSLDGGIGKDGKVYGPRSGFCLEPQHFPDSPNHPHFPTTLLRPSEQFQSTTIYRFSTD